MKKVNNNKNKFMIKMNFKKIIIINTRDAQYKSNDKCETDT